MSQGPTTHVTTHRTPHTARTAGVSGTRLPVEEPRGLVYPSDSEPLHSTEWCRRRRHSESGRADERSDSETQGKLLSVEINGCKVLLGWVELGVLRRWVTHTPKATLDGTTHHSPDTRLVPGDGRSETGDPRSRHTGTSRPTAHPILDWRLGVRGRTPDTLGPDTPGRDRYTKTTHTKRRTGNASTS